MFIGACLVLHVLSAETVRFLLDDYFSNIKWTELSENLETPQTNPYPIGNEEHPLFFADTADASDIYPSLIGLGILDYRGVPHSLLAALNSVIPHIQSAQITDRDCISDRPYLVSLLNFRLAMLTPIHAVYYGRPELSADGARAKVNIRLTITEDKNKFMIIIVSFINKEGWLISQIDFKGLSNDRSIKPN